MLDLCQLLGHGNNNVQAIGTKVMLQLAECGEYPSTFHPGVTDATFQDGLNMMAPNVIPKFLQALNNSSCGVHAAGAQILLKYVEHSES